MGFLGLGKKAVNNSPSVGDVGVQYSDGIHKAYIPEFLYKPPFGYPRKENIPLIRQLAKNPYIYSVVKTLCDEAASTKYDIVYKEDIEPSDNKDKARKEILKFLDNPNKNKESFQHIIRATVKDVCEVDSGVIVKVFNKRKEMVELFARDGGSFLMNPDIYGYLGNRSDIVEPEPINYAATPSSPDWTATLNHYSMSYKEIAAYFQYGTTAMALPVPFGRDEIIYLMMNPQSNNVYGLSPIQVLADVITTLVYGSNYNLDFYMNSNMPEGIIQLLGADNKAITAFRERFENQFKLKDANTGFMRKIGFRYPITNQEAKFTPFQLDPKTMEIITQQEWFTKILWACFGVTPDEMGFTENSNKAVSQGQTAVYKRKAVRPILNLLKYHFDKEIIAEWGEEVFDSLEFKWNDYDLEEDLKKHQLYQMQINMGIKTADMVAEEESINVEELKKSKQEADDLEMDKLEKQVGFGNDNEDFGNSEKKEKKEDKTGTKSEPYENNFEKDLSIAVKNRSKKMLEMLDLYKDNSLDKIR